MLRQLYLKGPFTVGIFRKSANARVCREVEADLESNPLFSLEDVSGTDIKTTASFRLGSHCCGCCIGNCGDGLGVFA